MALPKTALPSLEELLQPKKFEDLALPVETIARLNGMVRRGRIMNLLLVGDPGAGKTSTWQIATTMAGADVMEFSGTSKELTRSSFSGRTLGNVLHGQPVVYVIEEAEFMPKRVQASLRGIIKPDPRCSFILTTNDIRKIDPALVSRLTRISYFLLQSDRPRVIDNLQLRYEAILGELGVAYEKQRLAEIIATRFPDFRATAKGIEFEFFNRT